MSTTTPNIGLTKPVVTEDFELDVLNDNFDKIDTAAGTIPQSGTFTVTASSSTYPLEVNEGASFGKIRIFSLLASSSSAKSAGNVQVGTIAAKDRPLINTRVPVYMTNNWTTNECGWVNINTNGTICLSGGPATNWFGSLVWVTA